jgi:RHS repeat-associated protein
MKYIRSRQTTGWFSTLTGSAAILLAILLIPSSGYSSGTVTNLNWLDLDAALAGGGTVTIACDGVIYKPYTAPDTISTNTVIDATGHHIVLDGWDGWGGQMFVVQSNATLTLNNLTIADCLTSTNGSAVCNFGTNVVNNCTFTNDVAQGQFGTNGANGVNVSSGTAGSGTAGTPGGSIYGGAIYNQGVLIANGSTFADNQAYGATGGNGGNGGNSTTGTPGSGANGAVGGSAYGGAIYSANFTNVSLAITNCSFIGDQAAAGYGGEGGYAGIGASTVGANGLGGAGTNGYGGALYIYRNATVVNSTFYVCFAGDGQGGDCGQTTGAVNTTGGKGGNGYGGAIFNAGTNAIINCTFNQNEVAGGAGGAGGAGTTGGTGGLGGNGYGGGIYSTNQIGLTNCSLVLNAALAGAGGYGGYPSGSDGANGTFSGANLLRTNGTFTLKNSLFAYGTGYGGNGVGTFVDAGENLSDDSSITLNGTGSHSSINVMVTSTVEENGGPTATLSLLAGSPAINTADSTAAPKYDQRGFMRVGAPDIGAFEYGSGSVSIFAAGPTASLDGNVGLFVVGRIPPTLTPLTVNYTVSGTASNGVDYVQITNSVTIFTTVTNSATNYANYARIPLRGILGAFSLTNKSVTLTLNSGTNYQIDATDPLNPSTAAILISPQSTFNSAARYVRGTSTAPDFQSFVIPLNFQAGVTLAASGGNAATLFPGNQWTNTLYHFDATNSALETNITGRIAFQNPIVAFGSPVGGSPMYLNQSYGFGIHAGDATINYSNALRIQVYYRSNSALAGTISMPIPNPANSNQLANLVTNGFSQTFTQFGLQTVWLTIPGQRWGVLFSDTYTLTHTAMSPTVTNYYFVVEQMGNAAAAQPMVLNQSGAQDWSRLYAMEFSQMPANFATFINQPHFAEQPLPPAYAGATLQELTNVFPTLPNLSYLTPSNYLTIDASPELRRHPILDQFVANMGNDPLALANYVQNEIGLVDAIDYDTNYNSLPAVNLGGVNRSAVATFQEGQGSPMEQCALLVYLLRQAGVPATYIFPTNGGLQMLNSQASKLLRVQLQGAVSPLGQTNMPQLIALNYPWVAAYIGTNWVQIFPWIKDTEITEGFNFYDYMPTNYNSGFKWLTAFINNDTNIFSLSSSDQPLVLLPAFIQHNLDLNHYGLSVDDMGVQCLNRRHLYSQWSQFPEPFALSGTPLAVESLKTNMSLFNTLEIQVYSQANPTRLIDTTAIPIAELHNRKLLLKFQQVGTNNLHSMILSLEAYSPKVTNTWAFSTRADPTWALVSSNQLDSTDDNIIFQVTHTREHFLPGNYMASGEYGISNLWGYTYVEQGAQTGQSYVFTDTFRKGDLIAFGFDLGKVTSKMLNVYAQELWQFNQTANTNQPSTINPDIYEGTPVYLLAMSFFDYYDQFHDLNNQLHKIQLVSQYEQGYGLLRPQRDSSGNLINGGQINLITPAVHMPDNGFAAIFNGSLHPDSGQDFLSAYLNWWAQDAVQGSAAEHGTLRSFYQTNAISTVKLLQQVAPNMVVLNADNYLAAGQVSYNGVQLQNADTTTWNAIANLFSTDASGPDAVTFMTPGVVTNGTYVGVAALYFSYDIFSAAVGGLNGGYAYNFPTTTFTYANSPNITVDPAPAGSTTPFQLLTTATADNSGSSGNVVDGATPTWTQSATASSLASGQTQLDPTLSSTLINLSSLYGSQQNAPAAYNQLYNVGTASTTTPVYSDWTQTVADPVNMMTGEFYVDAPDITLPGPMPLQIRRNYGSQNLAENEFGFGWKTSYVPFLSVGTNSTLIYAAEMDGSMVAYRQTSTNANVWLPQPQDNPMLNNNSSMGIGSMGNLFNNRLQLSTPGGTNTYTLAGANGSTRTFTQASYPIGTFTRQRPYLNTWQDSKGNYYSYQYVTNSTQTGYGEVSRIQSSNGNFVWFEYDVYGHIIAAHTGDGRILNYVYDQYGDLVSVTLPDQMEIDYIYQHSNYVTNGVTNVYSTHLIVEEDKPDGRVLQNIYDSQRRVTNQLSTAGIDLNPITTATFAYTNNFSLTSPTNLLTGVTAISDYFKHTTTYYYTNSLVGRIVDPLNQTIVQNWYQTNTVGGFQRSLQSATDKRGLKTAYLYDSFGNLTNSVVTGDLTGDGIPTQTATNTASYNTNNLPVQITDTVGNSTVLIYDPVFNFLPQQTIRYSGATPVSTNFIVYGNATNVVVLGSTTQTNIALGIPTRKIRAYGSPDAATNDMFCNGQGFPTNSVQYTGTGDPNIVNQLFYDERGELIQRTDAVGANYTFVFDPMGRPTAQETFDTGQATPMDWKYSYYNENGELNWIDGPRYNPEDYIFYDYDGAGRPTTEIHWRSEANSNGTGVEAPAGNNLYAQMFSQFDPLGNLVSKIDPRGAVTTNTWDALCRLTHSTHLDTNGITVLSTDGFSYEPGGQVQSHTNALGGITTTFYNTAGQPEARFNADGSTNAWRYYLDGRINKEIQSNGAYWQTTYDDVNRITTKVFYSAAGAPEATNSTQLDRRGNVIQKVDAGGNIFTTTFDGLDRAKVTAGPAIVTVSSYQLGNPPSGTIYFATNVLQQVVTTFYDAAGRVLTNANAIGETTVTKMDAIGRTTSSQIYSASSTLVNETYLGYSADHNSVTTTNGSGASAIVNTAYTDNDGHTVLSIAYPSANTNEFTLNQFDLAGNLISEQHDSSASGTVTTWATASFAYNGLNRLISRTDRDSALTTYSYDSMGDLTNRTMPGNLQWQATYNNAGQMSQEQNYGGGSPTRTTTYTYYSSGNVFAGLLNIKTDGRGTSCTYTYDDWLRQATMTYGGSLPEQQLTTTWQYEPRGFVTNITEQFASTNTGPNTAITRSYDPYGQLASESVNGGSFAYGANQSWDVTGRRTQLNVGSGGYGFGWQADGNLVSASDPTGSGSYSFNTAGLLTSRTVGNRYTSIGSRDGEGRPLSITNMVNAVSALTESLSWSGDGLLASHTLARADFTDPHVYTYANSSRRLVQEQLNLNASTTWTNTMVYDKGVSGGPGVLTQMGLASSASNQWSGASDAFSRVATETNSTFQYPAYGHVNGQSVLLSAWLDSQPVSIAVVGTNAMQWRAMMELAPGVHQLIVSALHPSGVFTAWATNSFTNTLAYQMTADSYDASGNITNRVWKNPTGTVERTQTLSWDARGRLHQVFDRDANNSGYNWSAVYDPLNRRLQTTTVLVSNSVASTAPPQAINSYFDPQVEFLELGVSYGNQTIWKLYGPDLNGKYGGLNGTGGFDAVSPYLNLFNPVISDFRGNILAEVTNGAVSWTPARLTGYGAVPGYRPVAFANDADMAQSSAWRGRWVDITGYHQIGLRPYDSVSGRWLTYDSVWNARDPNYYTFCGGEPIMGFDPDGRLGKGFYNGASGLVTGTASLIYNAAGATEYALASTVAPDWAYQNLGGYAQNFANQVTGTAQFANNVASTAAYGAISPFAPDFAYNTYGGNVQQLIGQAPALYGGNNQSTAYQIGYGTVTAATMLFGGEESEAGNLGTVGDASSTVSQTSRFAPSATESQALVPYYPPNQGFVEAPAQATLVPGTVVDRYGGTGGSFLSPQGTPVGARSLPFGAENNTLNTYQVMQPINVNAGTAAPWFNQVGGGIQYDLGTSTVQDLINSGHLAPIHP